MEHAIQLIGCGNIGKRVAQLYLAQGIHAITTVNSDKSLHQCEVLGLPCTLLNLDLPFQLAEMHTQTRILYSVPPPRSGHSDTRLAAFLQQLDARQIDKLVLISTTGVYGDCAGAWVNEDTPIKPEADRAKRRADAERQTQAWAKQNHVDYLILRVPGIYSLDRLPLKRLQASTPMVRQEASPWTNRIHADDLASACYAAMQLDVVNEIINVADDAPCTMTDYFNTVADYAGLPRPPQIGPDEARQSLSAGMLSYLAESRRIDNQKMKARLKIRLQYPRLTDALK